MDGATALAQHIKNRDNPSPYTPMFGKIISLPELKIRFGSRILLDADDVKAAFDIYNETTVHKMIMFHLEGAAAVIIHDLGEVHYKRTITERNRWMAEQSDIILCYIYRSSGGAYNMYHYTQKLNKTIRKITMK